MADRDGTAPQRERSRGRSETRSRRSPEAQGVDTSRIERLETQVARLSDSLISLGPALQQVIQLSTNPNLVAQKCCCPDCSSGFSDANPTSTGATKSCTWFSPA